MYQPNIKRPPSQFRIQNPPSEPNSQLSKHTSQHRSSTATPVFALSFIPLDDRLALGAIPLRVLPNFSSKQAIIPAAGLSKRTKHQPP